jgi:hypothetical protein
LLHELQHFGLHVVYVLLTIGSPCAGFFDIWASNSEQEQQQQQQVLAMDGRPDSSQDPELLNAQYEATLPQYKSRIYGEQYADALHMLVVRTPAAPASVSMCTCTGSYAVS